MSYEQDINTPVRYFVGLVANLHLAPWGTVGGVALGEPAQEPEGVETRRFCFAHRFNAEDVADLNDRGAIAGASVLDELPEDWLDAKDV